MLTAMSDRYHAPGAQRENGRGCALTFERLEPNDLWQMDFTGHFALAAGHCNPLSVLDDHFAYALEIGACDNERGETVRAHLEAVFKRYGLPRRILADNGSPWGTTGSGQRHTRRSPSGCWTWDPGRPRPGLPSSEPGQGRALPPHLQGRGAGWPAAGNPQPGPRRLRSLARDLQRQRFERLHGTRRPA